MYADTCKCCPIWLHRPEITWSWVRMAGIFVEQCVHFTKVIQICWPMRSACTALGLCCGWKCEALNLIYHFLYWYRVMPYNYHAMRNDLTKTLWILSSLTSFCVKSFMDNTFNQGGIIKETWKPGCHKIFALVRNIW